MKEELIKRIENGESFSLCYNAGADWIEQGQDNYNEVVEEVINELKNAEDISDITDDIDDEDPLKLEFAEDLKNGARIYITLGTCMAIAI